MKRSKGADLVISIEGRRTIAVGASVGGRSVRIHAAHVWMMPDAVDPSEPAGVGRWLRERLRGAGMNGRALLALPRGNVVLKRMSFTLGDGAGLDDLPGLVSMGMVRQLTMAGEDTAVDYVVLDEQPTGDGLEVSVLAGALPGDRLAWVRAVANEAHLRLAGVTLKAFGYARTLGPDAETASGPVLAIAPAGGMCKFIVLEGGELVFARSLELGPADAGGIDAQAERIAVEAKRTWMSYRVTPESREVDSIVVYGQGELASLAASRCGAALEIPSRAWSDLDQVQADEGVDADLLIEAVPQARLLGGGKAREGLLDFASPRRAPDRAASRRKVALVGAFVLILVVGSAYLWAQREVGARRMTLSALKDRYGKLQREQYEYLRQSARAEHIERWLSIGMEPDAYLSSLVELLPAPGRVLVDQIGMRVTGEVRFESAAGSFVGGTWTSPQRVVIELDGGVESREVGDAMRGRLIDSGLFTVRNIGADEADTFALELVTDKSAPPIPVDVGATESGGAS